jgi:hypothetical protein
MPSFRLAVLACAALLGLALALRTPVESVLANGTPITVVLSYQKGISNWGPVNATGVAELVTKEGEVRLTTAGLPQLNGEQYQAWILNSGSGERLALGQFNTSADGVGKLDLLLKDPIPDKGWDTFLVTVETSTAATRDPSMRRSISGRFPTTDSGPGGSQAGAPQPVELPRTGGPDTTGATDAAGPNLGGLIGLGALLLLIGGAAGYGLGRVNRRRL